MNHSLKAAVAIAISYSMPAQALETDLYGSLRIGLEAVNPDNTAVFDNYVGLRDAYTRVGAKVSEEIAEGWTLSGKLELPLDLANLEHNSPNSEGDDVRVMKVQVDGPMGSAWYGKGWLAYYNYIAYPIDYFSSYYSGWATLTTFRRDHTFYYATPSINGFQAAFSTSDDDNMDADRRDQYVLSYAKDGLTLAIGRDDRNDQGSAHNGISATYTTGPWYIAAKHEEVDGGGSDGVKAKNLLVQYKLSEKDTVRGTIGSIDDSWAYVGDTYHVGWDHQYSDDLKVFAEYYSEDITGAMSDEKATSTSSAASGGQVFTTGIRYDFSL